MSRHKHGYRFANELLRELRRSSGRTRKQLADAAGVSPLQTQWWENGRSIPDTMRLPLVADVYGCKIDDLFVPAPK
jgi:transcriptional regulator with XRE-family HTH domain